MFSELVLEVLSEEIPSRMHKCMISQVEAYFNKSFAKDSISVSDMHIFINARRLVVYLSDIKFTNLDSISFIKGPRVGSKQNAIDGFLKKTGVSFDSLEVKTIKSEQFYCYVREVNASFLAQDILKNIIEGMFTHMSWPKSMRWGVNQFSWVRPILNILCLLDGKTFSISYASFDSNNKTQGNRFLSPEFFSVKNFEDYCKKISKQYVLLGYESRRDFVISQITDLTEKKHLCCENNEKLLDEILGFVEYPMVILGRVDERFFGLPQPVILTVMHHHQRYLAVRENGIIKNFIALTTLVSDDVIKGHEKVLRARLTDAQFLIDQDRRHDLDHYCAHLGNIVFHAKLGSLADKVKRVVFLAKYLSVWVPQASLIHVERAAQLCKADLSTAMVKEFPELQGVMGAYYAECLGEHSSVCGAISDHYMPVGANHDCPQSPVSIAIAIADKVDSMTGLIAIGEQPTSSGDPFAIRRMAIGIIRIIISNSLEIPLNLLLEKSASLFSKSIYSNARYSKKELPNIVFSFCVDRFRVMLQDSGYKPYEISAILGENLADDHFYRLYKKLEVFANYLSSEDGRLIINVYKRINNIITKSEKDGDVYTKKYKNSLLKDPAEIELALLAKKLYRPIKMSVKHKDHASSLAALHEIAVLVEKFMNEVKIQSSENKNHRDNRMMLITFVRSIFNSVIEFDKLFS